MAKVYATEGSRGSMEKSSPPRSEIVVLGSKTLQGCKNGANRHGYDYHDVQPETNSTLDVS